MDNNSDDLSAVYLESRDSGAGHNAEQMERWLDTFKTFDDAENPPFIEPLAERPSLEERRLPDPPKPRVKSKDDLGTPKADKESMAGKVMRNLSDIPTQAIGGVEDALINSGIFPLIDPLAQWINENIIDTRYGRIREPYSATGSVIRGISEFLTGFIPFLKGLRALGMSGKVAPPALAGVLADLTVRAPHEGRLIDVLHEAGLPKTVVTEYLASNPDDSEAEARFKNALEGLGLGMMMEGVFLGARALRAARHEPGVREAEEAFLRERYGEVLEEDYKRIVGDESKPLISTVVKQPPAAAAQEDIAAFAARAGEEIGGVSHLRGIVESLQRIYIEQGPKAGRAMLEDKAASAPEFSNFAKEVNMPGFVDDLDKELAKRARQFKERSLTRKTQKASEELPDFDPRALIRGKKGEILPEDFEVYINFARINEPDQVKFVIGKMAEGMKDHIDEARRGVITHAETEKLAADLNMTVSDLLARRKGQPFNAEEVVAARALWLASGDKLLELAKRANSPNAGALDHFAFRRHMAVHAAIQAEVIGARTEAARALSAWKIEVGREGSIARARAIQQIMEAAGGRETSAQMAKRLAILADAGADRATLSKFAVKGYAARSMDVLREIFVNGLLTSPKTHAVNISSNMLVALQSIYERAAAAGIRSFTGGEGVVPGEAAAMTFGLISSIKDAFRLSARALKTGETGYALSRMDAPRQHAISSEALGINNVGLGRFVDYLGTTVRVPGRLLGAEDEFFKTIGYRMELHAQAFRTAVHEGLKGDAMANRIAEILRNPPEHIKINAADAALYNTFTNEVGAFGKWVMSGRNIDSLFGLAIFILLPFVRAPVNIARYAFERSPFAPLVAQWRADIAAGGARADLALARMSTGTAIMLTAMDYADAGICSGRGPKDASQREALIRQGWQPYSCKIGDRWYSYNRTDPFGMTMGFAADIAEAVRKGEIDEDDVDEWYEVTAMAIAAVSQVTISKNYLEGFSRFVEVMSDPSRYSRRYIEDLVASFLPATALSNAVKNMVDPTLRETGSPADAVFARIAGLSDKLPPRRNLWGEPITTESGLGRVYDFIAPVQSKAAKDSPIDREIVRLGGGPNRIAKRTVFDGVDVNMRFFPEVYDEYVRLAGNGLKHPVFGMGAKDFLNAVVSGKHPMSSSYKTMSDAAQRDFISSTISDYRRLAQQQIMNDPRFRNFASEVNRIKELSMRNRMPVLEN